MEKNFIAQNNSSQSFSYRMKIVREIFFRALRFEKFRAFRFEYCSLFFFFFLSFFREKEIPGQKKIFPRRGNVGSIDSDRDNERQRLWGTMQECDQMRIPLIERFSSSFRNVVFREMTLGKNRWLATVSITLL